MRTAAVALLLVAAISSAGAQNATPESARRADEPQVYRSTGTRIAIARSIHVPADEEVNDGVVVVGGSLRVDGRVRNGIVVVGGNLDLGPQADVRGEIVLVGGRLTRDPQAQVRGRVSDISIGDWDWRSFGGITFPTIEFDRFEFGRWMSLFGTMFRIASLGVLMALVLLFARAPVARIGRAAGAEPGRAFLLGLAAEVLFLPMLIATSIGLIITIVGIPLVALLVPAAFIGAFVALLLGFTAVACRIGEWVEDRLRWRTHSALITTAIGLFVILTPTIVARMLGVMPAPAGLVGWGLLAVGALVEFVVWTIGLGATLMTGFGRWSTAPPPVPPVAPADTVPAPA